MAVGYPSPMQPYQRDPGPNTNPDRVDLLRQIQNQILPANTGALSPSLLYGGALPQMQDLYGQMTGLQHQLNAQYDPHLGQQYIQQMIAMMNAPNPQNDKGLAQSTVQRPSLTYYGVGYV